MDLASVRLRGVCKAFHFDCTGTPLRKGDFAVVSTERGPVLGEVVGRRDGVEPREGRPPYPRVVRAATVDDLQAHQENGKREAEARDVALRRIAARGLPMKLVRVEALIDRSKTIFYFTADGRIDFRELVKDLAHDLRTRIEMRQIGVRDESRAVGGVGPCGKEFCCATFLAEFEPITVKMAKDQKLVLNPAKLSGVCGRLMCCLIYEHEASGRGRPPAPAAPRTGGGEAAPGDDRSPAEAHPPAGEPGAGGNGGGEGPA